MAACGLLAPAHPGWRFGMIGADRFRPDAQPTPFVTGLLPQARAAGVDMTGYRPHADVLAAMGRAAIVVVPSRWPEPFGMTALEAMAAGAALVAAPMAACPKWWAKGDAVPARTRIRACAGGGRADGGPGRPRGPCRARAPAGRAFWHGPCPCPPRRIAHGMPAPPPRLTFFCTVGYGTGRPMALYLVGTRLTPASCTVAR
ncbi:glycosyltransferase [Komagataeibacter rhaeticus]|nr:glycosyltransferase [Komagataeibacter rhaeticus]